MTRFDELGSAYLARPLMETFGEAAVYVPKDGDPFDVTAIVDRGMLDFREVDGKARPEYELTVTVSRSAVERVNVSGDKIRFRKRSGDTAFATFTVTELLGQDGGMWRLGVQ